MFQSKRTLETVHRKKFGSGRDRVGERAKKKEGKAGGRGSYTTVGFLPRRATDKDNW